MPGNAIGFAARNPVVGMKGVGKQLGDRTAAADVDEIDIAVPIGLEFKIDCIPYTKCGLIDAQPDRQPGVHGCGIYLFKQLTLNFPNVIQRG